MFTLTKGYRRHTFLFTVGKTSIVARGDELVPQGEMEELMRRFRTSDPTVDPKVDEPSFRLISDTVMAAQMSNKSAAVGVV
jgi:hypothetical protein